MIAGCHLVFAEDRVHASTFSRALHRLEDLGLVERYRTTDIWEPWRYRITDAGREQTQAVSQVWARLLCSSAPAVGAEVAKWLVTHPTGAVVPEPAGRSSN